ncbi:MAG: fimbrial protein, partial [Rhodoferax sp.]
NNTPWFAKPELIEIVSGTASISAKEQKRVANFIIKVRLVRSSEAEKNAAKAAADAASSPVLPASAAASAPAKK